MKCPHCHALCPDHLPSCMECRWPFVIDYDEPPPRLPRRAATLFLALGLAISVSYIPANFPAKSDGVINLPRIGCIIGISAVCAALGYLAGLWICRARLAQARIPFQQGPKTPAQSHR
jgi:hypothetical protein